MSNLRNIKVLIAVLTLALLAALGGLAYAVWLNSQWKAEASELARDIGAQRAIKDFNAGKLKLLQIVGANAKDTFTGTNDGPFEIWVSQYFPGESFPVRCASEQQVVAYNTVMKNLLNQQVIRKKFSSTNDPTNGLMPVLHP